MGRPHPVGAADRASHRVSAAAGRFRSLALFLFFASAVALLAGGGAHGAALEVSTETPGHAIWVEGRYSGLTPVRIDSLSGDSVMVEVGAPPESTAWVRPWPFSVDLRRVREAAIRLPDLQALRIRSEPPGAVVSVDGRRMGQTPLSQWIPNLGLHRIGIRGPTGGVLDLAYDPGGRADSTLLFRLPGRPPATAPEERAGPGTWAERRHILLPVGAVLAGVVGVWARQTADRAYSDYETTTDRARMKRQLDRARGYDRVAVGCWIAAETFLAVAAWDWLRASHGE